MRSVPSSSEGASNVLLISLDCARADVAYSGILGSLSRLQAFGTTYANAVSSSPFTPASHATVFSGRLPFQHGLRHLFRKPIKDDVPMLAECFRANAYSTWAVVSCPGMHRWYGFSKGFDHYDDELSSLPNGADPLRVIDVKTRGLATKPAEEVTRRAIQIIHSLGREDRFFGFVHYFDAHWPYRHPAHLASNASNDYERSLLYVDQQIGHLLDALESAGMLSKTIILAFGDHGEDLGGLYANDKGGPGSKHPEEVGHGCLLYQTTQHVPLVLAHAGMDRLIVNSRVGLHDVAPTLVNLMRLRGWPTGSGMALASAGEGSQRRIFYAETLHPEEVAINRPELPGLCGLQAQWHGQHKIIRRFDNAIVECFDLENDPHELSPLPACKFPNELFVWPQDAVADL